MGKEVLSPYQAHQKRIDFIEKAVAEGVLDRIPISERGQDIALVYYLNDELSGEKIGNIFPQSSGKPLDRESVRKRGEKLLTAAYNAASPQLQSSHPLSELLTRKPSALSELNVRIKRSFERGASPAEIRSMEGTLGSARTTLRKRGIEIQTDHEYLKARVKTEVDDKKLQEILDSFTNPSLRGYIYNHKQDPEKAFVLLSSVLRKGGFFPHQHLSTFYAKIKEKGIPIRPVSPDESKPKKIYWIVFDKHGQRIIDDLKDVPDLQKFRTNPVQLVCGTLDREIPTTRAFQKKTDQQYEHLSKLAYHTIGFKSTTRPGQNLSTLVEGCPIPVFRNGHSFIYPLDRQEEMKAFLRSKQKKIR